MDHKDSFVIKLTCQYLLGNKMPVAIPVKLFSDKYLQLILTNLVVLRHVCCLWITSVETQWVSMRRITRKPTLRFQTDPSQTGLYLHRK